MYRKSPGRTLLSFCLVAVACLATRDSFAQEASTLRVMTFNVRYGTAKDGDNAWPRRKELVAKTIEAADPDLLGTQEMLPFQAEYLQGVLDGYAYVGWSREPDNPNGEQCGIYYRKERFERLDAGQFWLSETPDKPGSRSWDAALPRVATWVQLRDRLHPEPPLLFVNTHFDHVGSMARARSAEVIATRLKQSWPTTPTIMTGDFNCSDESAAYRTLTGQEGSQWFDTYRAVHAERKPGEGTFNGFRGTTDGARIDWILHNAAFRTNASMIDRTQENGRYPSDHFPITATLRWK